MTRDGNANRAVILERAPTKAHIDYIMEGNKHSDISFEFQSRYKRAFISKQSKKSIAAKGRRLHPE
jgi:hypothetical protein